MTKSAVFSPRNTPCVNAPEMTRPVTEVKMVIFSAARSQKRMYELFNGFPDKGLHGPLNRHPSNAPRSTRCPSWPPGIRIPDLTQHAVSRGPDRLRPTHWGRFRIGNTGRCRSGRWSRSRLQPTWRPEAHCPARFRFPAYVNVKCGFSDASGLAIQCDQMSRLYV